MEIITFLFISWFFSLLINVNYMMINNKPCIDKYLIAVLMPIINVLYTLSVVFHYKNIIKFIKCIIGLFVEPYKNTNKIICGNCIVTKKRKITR